MAQFSFAYWISRHNNVKISTHSKINFSTIRLSKNCILLVSHGSIIQAQLSFENGSSSIVVDKNTFIGTSHLVCSKKITIGDDVLISWGCTIVDHNSHAVEFSKRSADVAS